MFQILNALKNCPIFSNIPEQIINDNIVPNGSIKSFKKGEQIFKHQDVINHFIIVVSGIIHSIFIYENGHYSVIDSIEKSEIAGIDLVLTKTRISPYIAISATDTTVFYISISKIHGKYSCINEFQYEISEQLLRLISDDNMRKMYRIIILSKRGIRERIITYFTMQSNKHKKKNISIPFSRDELASFLCVNRSALSHELSLMKKEGLINFHKNHFEILYNTNLK